MTSILIEEAAPDGMAYRPPLNTREVRADEAFGVLHGSDLLSAPPVLYAAGDVAILQSKIRIAVVGTREPSDEGRRRATKLACQLAEAGAVVVSGLAMGIDAAAHRGAIQAGGRTIAVIATPLDKATPIENVDLQEAIYKDHLLVSQFSAGSEVRRSNFLARNRTMAMLSHASVIVEAGETSGTLNQARETMRLGHPLFIMKSTAEDPRLSWPKKFIAKGAMVLSDTVQLLETLLGPRRATG